MTHRASPPAAELETSCHCCQSPNDPGKRCLSASTSDRHIDEFRQTNNILAMLRLPVSLLDPLKSTFKAVVRRIDQYAHPPTRRKNYSLAMDSADFRKNGKKMVDYIADYLDNVHKRRVTAKVQPGYMRYLLPKEAPHKPETFDEILEDVESVIMPGITHWQHPRFHAFFPAGDSYPSLLGDMLSDAFGVVGFSWGACPALTELEVITVNWLGRAIGLPDSFLPYTDTKGGGVIQGTSSECALITMLAARHNILRNKDPDLLNKLMAYISTESHSSIEKACKICMVRPREVQANEKFQMTAETLKLAIEEDTKNNLIPFYVAVTLGTTSSCSFDELSKIGPLCQELGIWLHVDAAYAGSAFICPEFRYLLEGIEFADSISIGPHKWLLVHQDCAVMWVKNQVQITDALSINPTYLNHSYMKETIDIRHWTISLGRRFRSLKLWFVMRLYGIEGLQTYIREHCRLAKRFEKLLQRDSRFEIMAEVTMGLVVFRLIAKNSVNRCVLSHINTLGEIALTQCTLNGQYSIRFCVNSETACDDDIDVAVKVIKDAADRVQHRHKKARQIGDTGPRSKTNNLMKGS